ncbi:two component transcriptional regulator, winged helix family [Stanieria cyanosphaera PCC 7437]|uniref:Two component transcriptional regulator, winged helix family n=1 Tax=Stanieria cyanosphaera (strain ATCC 29371 / PCC 7437) TaxID=111780 RepID=K9XQE0_STAC7|nr:two-component system response regulator RppA [Stanieria cyanosphaera]AFZ34271.1 two component transcriptional regulator, winged helix family [Stanieria cyanosphaera PCC 7437]
MKILLVEDDLEQLEPMQTALSEFGYWVDGIEDGEIAHWLMFQKEYDLLILDWMLPKVSGLELCQQYRNSGKTTPILMLTAKDTINDKVTGLDAGADDYLVKPVNIIELLARVRALSRRSPVWQGDRLQVADLQLNMTTLNLERQATTVSLSPREFQLLEYFLRHPYQVLTRNQIEEYLWEWGEEPESNAITAAVRRLRQRLKLVNAEDWIETVYGMGYRLNPPSQGSAV